MPAPPGSGAQDPKAPIPSTSLFPWLWERDARGVLHAPAWSVTVKVAIQWLDAKDYTGWTTFMVYGNDVELLEKSREAEGLVWAEEKMLADKPVQLLVEIPFTKKNPRDKKMRKTQAPLGRAEKNPGPLAAIFLTKGLDPALDEVEGAGKDWVKRVKRAGRKLKRGDVAGYAEESARAGVEVPLEAARRTVRVAKATVNPQVEPRVFVQLLAQLRAIQWTAWTAHWVVGGPSFYGDHLLLERLYVGEEANTFRAQVDDLGERLVSTFGPQVIEPTAISALALAQIQQVGTEKDHWTALKRLEVRARRLIQQAAVAAEHLPSGLGWDDYLTGLARTRDKALYLVGRRIHV
jgi:DNA-binding ferritin-like protein